MKKLWLWCCCLLLACSGLSQEVAAGACGQARPAGMHEGELVSGVLTRSYQIYVPPGWDNRQPGPLVIGLHGGYGTGEEFARQTHIRKAADRHNMLVLLPDGFRRSWNAGSCCKPAAKQGVRDVAFIRALVDEVAGQYCVDRGRVFATGFSNGAMLTHRLACEAPGLLRGIAPVSGGLMRPQCDQPAPVAALLLQGRDDPRIFWDGGLFDGSYRPAMREMVAQLAGRNGCAADEQATAKAASGLQCWEREACGDHPLRYCAISGVGHQWPGGKTYWPGRLGANTQAVDATALIFEFFAALEPARSH